MADEMTREPVPEQGQEARVPGPEDGEHEPVDLPNRQALSIIGPDVPVGGVTLYPGLSDGPLRGPEADSGITQPGGTPTS
jgi:hypothetical protein